MPAINSLRGDPGFLYWCSGLLGYCYEHDIDRPWISDMIREDLAVDGAAAGITPQQRPAPQPSGDPTGKFDDAVLRFVKAEPGGIGYDRLEPALREAGWTRPKNQIGAALKRLVAKSLIEQHGNLWRGTRAVRVTVSRVTPARDTAAARRRRQTPAAERATTATEEKQPAAAAA